MSNDQDAVAWNTLFKAFLEEARPSLKNSNIEIVTQPVTTNNSLPTLAIIAEYSTVEGPQSCVLPLAVIPKNYHGPDKQVSLVINTGDYGSGRQEITKLLPQPASVLLNSAFSTNTLNAVKAQLKGGVGVRSPIGTPAVDPTRDKDEAARFIRKVIGELLRVVSETSVAHLRKVDPQRVAAPTVVGQTFRVIEQFAAQNTKNTFQNASQRVIDAAPVRSDVVVDLALKSNGEQGDLPIAQVTAFVELMSGPKRGAFRQNNGIFGNVNTDPRFNDGRFYTGILSPNIRITSFGVSDPTRPKYWYATVLLNMLRLAADASGKLLQRALAPDAGSRVGGFNRRNLGVYDTEITTVPVEDGRYFVRDLLDPHELQFYAGYLRLLLSTDESDDFNKKPYQLQGSNLSFDYQDGSVEGGPLRLFRLAAMSDQYISNQPKETQATFYEERNKANEEVIAIFDMLTSGQFSQFLGGSNIQVFTDNNRMIAFGTYTDEASGERDLRELDTLAFDNYLTADRSVAYPFEQMIQYQRTITDSGANAEARLALQLEYWRQAGRVIHMTGTGWVISLTPAAYIALVHFFEANNGNFRQQRQLEGTATNNGNYSVGNATPLPSLATLSFDAINYGGQQGGGYQMPSFSSI